MTSVYSFFVAIICYSITILVVALLSRRDSFLIRYSTSAALLFTVLAIVRMLLPLDFSFTLVIPSYKVLPAVRDALAMDVMAGEEYLKLSTLLICVWTAGALAVIINKVWIMAVGILQVRRYKAVESPRAERVFSEMSLKNAELTVTPDVVMPMVTGVFKAHIFLPELNLTDSDLEFIIRHEYQHFKSRDTLIKVFYMVISAVFWWNPAVYFFQGRLDDLLEFRCDANLTRSMDQNEKHAYLSVILKVLKQAGARGNNGLPTLALPLSKTKAARCVIVRRFEYVFNLDRENPKARNRLMAAAVLVFLLSFMVIVQPAGYPEGDISEAGVAITPENSYILVHEDNSMGLYVNGKFFWDVSEERLDLGPEANLPIYKLGDKIR